MCCEDGRISTKFFLLNFCGWYDVKVCITLNMSDKPILLAWTANQNTGFTLFHPLKYLDTLWYSFLGHLLIIACKTSNWDRGRDS